VLWGTRSGEVTLRIYDASGERVGYIRTPAATGQQNFRKLSAAAQPVTILLTAAEGQERPRLHARASARIAP
jgi:hypothetical protein